MIECPCCGAKWEARDVIDALTEHWGDNTLFVAHAKLPSGFEIGVDVLEALGKLGDNRVFIFKCPKCQKEAEK